MKYLKIYENFRDDTKLKILLSKIIEFLNSLGYTNKNYLNRGVWETEFYKDSYKIFTIEMGYSYETEFITIKTGYNLEDIDFILSYLKTIKGLKLPKSLAKNIIGLPIYKFQITDIDKVLEQISKEDFDFKQTVNKYNL